jgi:two-component system, chemotaxis family, CheB/CheR fusion protein
MNKKEKASNATTKNYVVAIGASAGGLEAIHELFDNMPADTGFSFIIIQHLSPDYKSLMPELLARHTTMEIVEASHKLKIERNKIYVIPSKKLMTIKNGELQLQEKQLDHLPNTAIDIFFHSLAEDSSRAIGIILSGTGTDGSKGIESIKNAGGIVIVQDPVSAKFDGMPNSAIGTGCADLILPPELMAHELQEFILEAPFLKAFNDLNKRDEGILKEILELVWKQTGYDFSNYKRPTIDRRLIRRMAHKSVTSLHDYRNLLISDDDEVQRLSKEFLIGVTKFFRDEEAFEEVRQQVLPAILDNRSHGETIKVWVVACSSGEEAYSFAILIQEYLEQVKRTDLNIKIFASDIDHAALDVASRGIYPASITNDISPYRLERFFTKEGDQFRIIPTIRKMVVIAPHDILKDPPFSKLDLVSCRNMLIYMNSELQQKVLKTFHFALNTGGFLLMGPSENIGVLKEHMTEVNKKWKIYRTIERARMLDNGYYLMQPDTRVIQKSGSLPKPKNALNHVAEIFRDTIIEEYNYASFLIDKEFEIKQAIGNFKSFLHLPDGNFNFNLLKLVTPELAITLSTNLRRAIKDNQKVSIKHLKIRDENGVARSINIIIKPYLQHHEYMQPFLFVVLSEQEIVEKVKKENFVDHPATDLVERIREMDQELLETKENLQAVVEELETSNEELQSSNEEMISANEELQSTNEELQSLNEELHTVNAEHQLKIKELIELNDDLNNYFSNVEIGQLLIDRNLIIRKFTPYAKQQINVIETDIGRRISDLSNNFANTNFLADVKQVLNTSSPIEKEVRTYDGRIYRMRINPFLRQDKTSDGVVTTFIDITELKELNSLIEGVFNSSVSGIMALKAVRDADDKITDLELLTANHAAEKVLTVSPGELIGKQIKRDFPTTNVSIYNKYVEVIETGNNLLLEYFLEKENKWYQLIGVKMQDGLVVTFADITEQKNSHNLLAKGFEELRHTSNELRSSNSELERSNYDLLQFASVASHDLKEPLRKIQTYGNLLFAKASGQLKENELRYLEKMVKSSQRMQVLIDDVLMFSKLSNKNNFYTDTNINHIIQRIIEDLEIIIKERNVQFDISLIPNIEAIPGQVHQLFQNLISNALKFNDKKQPLISISPIEVTIREEAEFGINAAEFIGIRVQDNGIGFSDKYRDKIFKIFQRLHSQSEYQGTGIGLAICKKIVENHNGFIKVESDVGTGSSFMVYLPIKQMQLTNGINVEEAMQN